VKKFFLNLIALLSLFGAGHAYALTSGTTTTGSLTPGGTANYSFTGTAGQGVLLYGDASYTVYIIVMAPDGSFWANANNRISGTLPATGTYTVIARGSSIFNSGHQQRILQTQKSLRSKLTLADTKGCKNYPFDAWSWASRPAPSQPLPR
jgi:hypothetical protein